MSQAQYRLTAPGGGELEAGSGEVTVADGILELRPAAGAALRIPPGRIAAITEPRPYAIGIALTDGTAIELSRLGVMRTRLIAELADARAGAAADASGAVGDAVTFSATVAAASADLLVFEDALLVVSATATERIGFAFIGDVRARDYTVTITVAGRAPLSVSRLARRTDEFVALLRERTAAARTRTAAFLGSLLPGLGPMGQRAAAGLLRDGVAVPARALDAIHPELSATLLRVATMSARTAPVAELASRADLAIGFKQVASVRRGAAGGTPWRDHAAPPHIGQHDSPGGLFGGGLAGAMAAEVMRDMGPGGFGGHGRGGFGGPGDLGGYWAYRALGGGMNWNSNAGAHQPGARRAAPVPGRLTPEAEDLAALTTDGDTPTVLAFALACPLAGGGVVAYEVLNLPEPLTFVYQAAGPDPRAVINRALDDAGFAAAGVHGAASGALTATHRPDATTSPLATALIAQVPHDADWLHRLTGLLAGLPASGHATRDGRRSGPR